MTAKDAYTYTLVELNKLEAPSLLLEDFNYFINKAVQQYINKVYNRYETTQQSTDDLKALRRTVELDVASSQWSDMKDLGNYCTLPSDYLHMLNCIVKFEKNKNNSQNSCGTKYLSIADEDWIPAKKLTSDSYPSILTNAYLKPSIRQPYYFINSVPMLKPNNQDTLGSNNNDLAKLIEEENTSAETEYRNVLEIRCGNTAHYIPTKVYIDYLKTPDSINLTLAQIDGISDSQTLEFSDYVCYEIINELTKLILENIGDTTRLQTNIPLNQTVGLK